MLFASVNHARGQEQSITIGILHYPPYAFQNEQKTFQGAVIDIIRESYKLAGYRVTFVIMPYRRTILHAESGQIDAAGMLNLSTSSKLRLSAHKTVSLRQAFFTSSDSTWQFDGITSLKNKKLLTVQGYNYNSVSAQYQYQLDSNPDTVELASNKNYMRDAALMLANKSVDLFNEDLASMNYALRKHGLQNRVKSAGEFKTSLAIHLGFTPSPRGDIYRAAFDKSFTHLLNDGTISDILQKYQVYR